MFTGIIEAKGQVTGIEEIGGDRRFEIGLGNIAQSDVRLGDSVAINGVCLTAVAFGNHSMFADVSLETLRCTTLGELSVGEAVNLEMALLASSRLGGHMVSGHVDGVGEVKSRSSDARSERIEFTAPSDISRYIAAKGSICVDGVSLTVNEVTGDVFAVNIVPHTLEETNLGRCQAGVKVNLEIDLIARYLERLLSAGSASAEFPVMAGDIINKPMG